MFLVRGGNRWDPSAHDNIKCYGVKEDIFWSDKHTKRNENATKKFYALMNWESFKVYLQHRKNSLFGAQGHFLLILIMI